MAIVVKTNKLGKKNKICVCLVLRPGYDFFRAAIPLSKSCSGYMILDLMKSNALQNAAITLGIGVKETTTCRHITPLARFQVLLQGN